MRNALRIFFVFSAIIVTQAKADGPFDRCIRQLCTSVQQSNCWVKAGAAICDKDQISCGKIPDHAPATVIEKQERRWLVLTQFGQGWVSDRMMMLNGAACKTK
jgi:hypothetical protein